VVCAFFVVCWRTEKFLEPPFRRVPRPPFYRSREEPWGYTTKEGRKKRERSAREEASVEVLLLLPQAGPSGPVVEDGGGPSHCRAVVAAGNDGMSFA
jgi:hypothetical protein